MPPAKHLPFLIMALPPPTSHAYPPPDPVPLLPSETLAEIFDYLSPAALTRAILVSRRWRAIAERILYSSVVITENIPRTSPTPFTNMSDSPAVPDTTLRCCETLSHNPSLAEVVRRFHIRWQTDSVESPAFLLMIAQNIMQSLIPTFLHLESLELHFGLSEHFPSTHNHFPAFAAPRLRHLSLSGMGESPELLLRNHPGLLHFKLADYHGRVVLRPHDLPRLHSFRGNPVTAASILPGRPVQWLSLVGWEFVTEQDLTLMARTTTPIRNLDLSAMSVTPILLRDISRHLYHIECLRVKLALRHTLHFALSGIVRASLVYLQRLQTLRLIRLQKLLAALTTVLGEFQELCTLDLSPTNAVDGAGSSSAAEEEQLCMSWMRACPSLRRVTFPSKTEWTLVGGEIWISEVSACISRS